MFLQFESLSRCRVIKQCNGCVLAPDVASSGREPDHTL